MSGPKASVIIPAYNVENYIQETLESLLKQSYDDFEAIIVDDCSTDNTQASIQLYLSDRRLRCVRHRQNSGAAEARNTALRIARGEWIALLDADDIWLPGKLEEQVKLAQSDTDVNLIYSNIVSFFPDGHEELAFQESQLPEGDITASIYVRNFLSASSVLVKASDLRAIGGFSDQKLVEDYDAWLKLAYNGIWARKCAGPTVRYRVRAGSQLSSNLLNLQILIETLDRALKREDRWRYARTLGRHIGRVKGELAYTLAAENAKTSGNQVKKHLFKAWKYRPAKLKWFVMASICCSAVGKRIVTDRLKQNMKDWNKGRI